MSGRRGLEWTSISHYINVSLVNWARNYLFQLTNVQSTVNCTFLAGYQRSVLDDGVILLIRDVP